MKQLVILSGKGGTGKTSVAAAFAHLAAEGPHGMPAVLADADVDASNLELVLAPRVVREEDFWSGEVACIDEKTCNGCGICLETCRFDAIRQEEGRFVVDGVACEGCAACRYACPCEAISMLEQQAGRWYESETRFGPLYHAALFPGQENSGKLVTLIRQQARLRALDDGSALVIVDGPPGIGCPVISAASGADVALIVAEPSSAGIHGLGRILETTAHFDVRSLVCVNKHDMHSSGTKEIVDYCEEHAVKLVGRIPFDLSVTEAMVRGEPVTAYAAQSAASMALRSLWKETAAHLQGREG
jgi:MinD superfamily P-loop ATPase